MIELPDFGAPAAHGVHAIARQRLARALARDRGARLDTIPGAAPRVLQFESPGDQRVEVSASLEGSGVAARDADPDFSSPSGVHLRFGVQTGRWLAYSHVLAGHVENGLAFAQAILPGNDAVLHSEEAYLDYTAEGGRWGVQAGRGRWHWGPGEAGSLLLSKTSAPLTAMAMHLRIEGLRADGMTLSATLDQAAGEQLAAHRLEWQPRDGLRLGVSEAARYKSATWELPYWVGVLPYALVHNLLAQDEPESTRALHDNVEAAFDVAWRFVPGNRAYAEVLIDDLKTDNSLIVNKYGYQLGWEGVGAVSGRRVSWGTEYTRLTRFVYTSYFGRSFVAQNRSLGFPTGPDARRTRVRVAWDPSAAWQVRGVATRTDRGQSGLDVPFIPGTPPVNSARFAGVVETTRDAEIGVRYWPGAWLDLTLAAGYSWVDDAGHVPGADRRAGRVGLSVRVVR